MPQLGNRSWRLSGWRVNKIPTQHSTSKSCASFATRTSGGNISLIILVIVAAWHGPQHSPLNQNPNITTWLKYGIYYKFWETTTIPVAAEGGRCNRFPTFGKRDIIFGPAAGAFHIIKLSKLETPKGTTKQQQQSFHQHMILIFIITCQTATSRKPFRGR